MGALRGGRTYSLLLLCLLYCLMYSVCSERVIPMAREGNDIKQTWLTSFYPVFFPFTASRMSFIPRAWNSTSKSTKKKLSVITSVSSKRGPGEKRGCVQSDTLVHGKVGVDYDDMLQVHCKIADEKYIAFE